jgi:hypothetical protein
MSQMGSHNSIGHLKHKLWPKKKSRVKVPIWFPTTKVKNCPNLLMYRWCATYHWKAFNKGYYFSLDFTSIKDLHTKLWASKVARVPISRISRLGSPETKWYLGAGPVARHRGYYKGEGGGFSQVWTVMNLANLCLLVVRLCTKSAPIMH